MTLERICRQFSKFLYAGIIAKRPQLRVVKHTRLIGFKAGVNRERAYLESISYY